MWKENAEREEIADGKENTNTNFDIAYEAQESNCQLQPEEKLLWIGLEK